MNNDLISREALKEFINKVCFSKEWVKYRVDYGSRGQIDCILTYIDNAPSVEYPFYQEAYQTGYEEAKKEFERPTGEWVKLEDGSVVCPICKTGTSIKSIPSVIFFGYCPYCGADMRKPQTQKFADNDTAYGGLASAT